MALIRQVQLQTDRKTTPGSALGNSTGPTHSRTMVGSSQKARLDRLLCVQHGHGLPGMGSPVFPVIATRRTSYSPSQEPLVLLPPPDEVSASFAGYPLVSPSCQALPPHAKEPWLPALQAAACSFLSNEEFNPFLDHLPPVAGPPPVAGWNEMKSLLDTPSGTTVLGEGAAALAQGCVCVRCSETGQRGEGSV